MVIMLLLDYMVQYFKGFWYLNERLYNITITLLSNYLSLDHVMFTTCQEVGDMITRGAGQIMLPWWQRIRNIYTNQDITVMVETLNMFLLHPVTMVTSSQMYHNINNTKLYNELYI